MTQEDAKMTGSAADRIAGKLSTHQTQTLFWLGVAVLLAGLFLFVRGPGMFAYQGWQASSWQEGKASVTSVERTQQRKRSALRVNYIYDWNGLSYEGSRLSLSRGGGEWRDLLVAKLEEAKAAGTQVDIYVNPDNPKQSVIDRTMRWDEVGKLGYFGLVIAALGAACIYLAGRAKKLHAA